MKKYLPLLILFGVIFVFCFQFFLKGMLPVPADSLVGLYHPFRDLYAEQYPNGIPFKNFLITDPVRQIIPWKAIAVDTWKSLYIPLWNPYEMTGKPLLGNIQSGVLYPLNILLFVSPFWLGWSAFIIAQLLLGVFFMYLYLRNKDLHPLAIITGVLAWTFSGFFTAWLEWGNILHTALWLPLILLCIDRMFEQNIGTLNIKYKIKGQTGWLLVYALSLTFSFFAGHLQTFFYILVFSFSYFIFQWTNNRKLLILLKYGILNTFVIILTAFQWIPAVQFINLSARAFDQEDWHKAGWFIPWQHLVQFIVPDYFGNPTTLNYWGVWNYGEFVGYVGLIPLMLALLSVFDKKNRLRIFFITTVIISLLLALPNVISYIPFQTHIPFISTAQPTRLLVLICFSLAVLAAFGFNYLVHLKKNLAVFIALSIFVTMFALILTTVFIPNLFFNISAANMAVAKRNIILPLGFWLSGSVILVIYCLVKNARIRLLLLVLLVGITVIDLFRFFTKFESFSLQEYFYPKTKIITYIASQPGQFRVAALDSRILPPNTATWYKIQSVEGYDPLYLLSYAELIASIERGKVDISPPFGYNRIITPHNIESPLFDLLQVKYVLSLSEIDNPEYEKVMNEGNTYVYENTNVLPRTFFVSSVEHIEEKEKQLSRLITIDLRKSAVVSDSLHKKEFSIGKAEIASYTENEVVINTSNEGEGFLVFLDAYYPSWDVLIDGSKSTMYKTDYSFRGVVIPKGKHTVSFVSSFL